MLPPPIASQRLEPVAWRHLEVIERLRAVQEAQLAQCDGLNNWRKTADEAAIPDRLSPPITKAADHREYDA
jgi:hypothetical protein